MSVGGFVYVMHWGGEADRVKVGSSAFPADRAKSLTRQLDRELVVSAAVECPGRNTPTRTIDFVFDTQNISPLDRIPAQPTSAAGAAEKVRLTDADRALLAELEDFPSNTLPPLRAHEGSWIATSPDGRVLEFFEQADAQKALEAGWTVRTAGDHLANLNRSGPNAGPSRPPPRPRPPPRRQQ